MKIRYPVKVNVDPSNLPPIGSKVFWDGKEFILEKEGINDLWQFTNGATPSNAQISCTYSSGAASFPNSGTASISISDNSLSNIDHDFIFSNLSAGSILTIKLILSESGQSKELRFDNRSEVFASYTLDNPAIGFGTYWQFNVTYLSGSGTFPSFSSWLFSNRRVRVEITPSGGSSFFSGTASYIAKFDSNNSIVNSTLYEVPDFINTNGLSGATGSGIRTLGGDIDTRYAGGGGNIITGVIGETPGYIYTGGGTISTDGGYIDTGSGAISTTGNLNMLAGNIIVTQGDITITQGNIDMTGAGNILITGDIDGVNTNPPGSTARLVNFDLVSATTKTFDITHPTKGSPWRLRYGVLEGQEHGVYFRGKATTNIIQLPYYAHDLVDFETLTLTLTPIGTSTAHFYISTDVENNQILIDSDTGVINCFYLVMAERKDTDRIVTEYIKE
jgi:hypothetical protein